ncbi:MAG TPA: coproporphyrinogen dehydrogenase HemZ, partial [Clostridiaceae bacterium]|nr:coproporphyrinogen dehydrogenase HemZ [Clostridiaceae bacterium]
MALKESMLLKSVDTENSVDIYIGMPFCPSRCLYCSFASNVYRGNQYKDRYLELLKQEMQIIRSHIDGNSLN